MATRTEEIGRIKTCQKCKKGHFDTVQTNFAVLLPHWPFMQKHLVRPQFATGFQKAPFGRRTNGPVPYFRALSRAGAGVSDETRTWCAAAPAARKKLIPKTIGNTGKRDCAWGCAWGINTTWENLQIEKHKSERRSFRSPIGFVLFDLQIFSGGVYSPSATSRTISFSISNSFWN